MAIRTATRTAKGRTHERNEDAVRVAAVAGWQVLVVADGMGGHPAGHVASETAVDAFVDAVKAGLTDPSDEAVAADGNDPEAILRGAAEAADAAVSDQATGEREGMGCTLVAALVRESEEYVVNVGDSRAYHVTEDEITQRSVDHTVARELVERGEITAAEAKLHAKRGVLSQRLGGTEGVEPSTVADHLPGTLLLCTDGLTDDLSDERIHERVREADDLASAGAALVEQAETYGSRDDVTVALARPA
jgi:serine/threonine protein phosphatase PrpC